MNVILSATVGVGALCLITGFVALGAGLASALWLLDKEDASIAEAKKMLSLKYIHLKNTKTGLMDHVLDVYEADVRETAMPIRQWFAERYDAAALTASFYAKMGWPQPDAK